MRMNMYRFSTWSSCDHRVVGINRLSMPIAHHRAYLKERILIFSIRYRLSIDNIVGPWDLNKYEE